jgi:hypothetical protein
MIAATASSGCGGGSSTTTPDATDVGFNKPPTTVKANMSSGGVWTELGDADLTSCVADVATSGPVMLTTLVKDFQNQTAVPAAQVIGFPTIDTGTVFDMKTSDTNGNVTLTIPAGTKRYGLKMTGDFFPTFLLNQYVVPDKVTAGATTDPASIQSVSNATAALLPALIGQTRTVGTGVVAGAVRDCQHHELSNFVATISSTSGTSTPIAGAQAFYFSLDPELPVHHKSADASNQNGLFMAIQVPVTTTAYVQAWGFPTAADLASGEMKLISELAVPVLGDTVITGSFEPIHP